MKIILFFITLSFFSFHSKAQSESEISYEVRKEITEKLHEVHIKDQENRLKINDVAAKYGWDSKEMKDFWEEISQQDEKNFIIVKEILDKYGWVGSNKIGSEANTTLFLVIQHANLEKQVKYLPMLREATKNGNADLQSLALLEDRVLLASGKKQLYGTQIGRDPKTNTYFVQPLEDPDNVDKRRAEVKMEPIASYVKTWHIAWDVEEYKKDLKLKEKN